MRKIVNNSGTSLVEALVSVVIFLMIMTGFYSVATVGDNSFQVNRVQIELQQELRKSMEAMISDLRMAGSASVIDVPANDTWYTSITFRKPVGIVAGSINWDSNTIQFLRGGTGGVQLQRVYNGTTRVVSQYISTLQFRRLSADPDRLEVQLVGQRNSTKGVPVTYNLDFDIQLRN
ncbi:MAG: hypothetical protein KC897_05800 [Candidatus Omnitrophica bacterium]|nr:hypothetical protein [Candidatus Omnitrophota bacterium]MCB9720956.1 hypothetical protein [Candidatus Omnitrophota bacterium]